MLLIFINKIKNVLAINVSTAIKSGVCDMARAVLYEAVSLQIGISQDELQPNYQASD